MLYLCILCGVYTGYYMLLLYYFYEISPKGTVPVLQLSGGNIIDQSLDIMKWCLEHNDPNNWYSDKSYEQKPHRSLRHYNHHDL